MKNQKQHRELCVCVCGEELEKAQRLIVNGKK